jgi:hypothetical protein
MKVPWIAPAFVPAAGVAPVPRCCVKDCVALAFITAPFFNSSFIPFSNFGPNFAERGWAIADVKLVPSLLHNLL